MEGWKTKRTETSRDRSRHLLAVAEGRESMNDADYRDPRNWRQASRALTGRSMSTRKLKQSVARADRLEANATDAIVWLVMINLDEGKCFRDFFLSHVNVLMVRMCRRRDTGS